MSDFITISIFRNFNKGKIMKKYLATIAFGALFSTTSFAADWFHLSKYSTTSAMIGITSADYIQFNAKDKTLTVDSNTSAAAVVFGGGDIGDATIDLKETFTLTLSGLYGNDSRTADSVIEFKGKGNLVYTGTELNFVKQAADVLTSYVYNIEGTFSIVDKNIKVGEKIVVDFGSVTVGKVNFDIANNGYVAFSKKTGSSWVCGKVIVADGGSFDFNTSEYELYAGSSIGRVSQVSHLSNDKVYIIGTTVISADTGTITYGTKEGAGTLLLKATTLTLKTTNSLKRLDGKLNSLGVNENGAKLVLEAKQDFNNINFNTKTGVTFTIDLKGNDATEASLLNINSITQLEGNKILIEDFCENKVWVETKLSTDADGKLVNIFALDGTEEIGLYQLETGYLSLSPTAVPEPAYWAMIFGGIALGFVAYRRRK